MLQLRIEGDINFSTEITEPLGRDVIGLVMDRKYKKVSGVVKSTPPTGSVKSQTVEPVVDVPKDAGYEPSPNAEDGEPP